VSAPAKSLFLPELLQCGLATELESVILFAANDNRKSSYYLVIETSDMARALCPNHPSLGAGVAVAALILADPGLGTLRLLSMGGPAIPLRVAQRKPSMVR
jgi:hypothetical protein